MVETNVESVSVEAPVNVQLSSSGVVESVRSWIEDTTDKLIEGSPTVLYPVIASVLLVFAGATIWRLYK